MERVVGQRLGRVASIDIELKCFKGSRENMKNIFSLFHFYYLFFYYQLLLLLKIIQHKCERNDVPIQA